MIGMAKEYYVADLRRSIGLTGDSVFALSRKEQRTTRNNKPYLDLILRDRTGEINAKVWADSLGNVEEVAAGEVVRVEFEVRDYQGNAELVVRSLKKEDEFDTEDLMPVNESVEIDELTKELRRRIDSIRDIHLRKLVDAFFDDAEFYSAFINSPAAQKIHHNHQHGLLQHTLEMLRILDAVCSIYPDINRDLIVVGALLHDVGKIKEIKADLAGNIEYTDDGKLIGHVTLGAMMVTSKMDVDFPKHLRSQLIHIILSHQGKKEQGSPVLPATREAMAVYYADAMSTYLNITEKEFREGVQAPEGDNFSRFNKYLGTSVYVGD